ncbi:MAG: hypothetical protein JST80_12335 [Bdellovibrionales bacterium]|nr:hypothetical protein [Bdellovibrionales bacterium]
MSIQIKKGSILVYRVFDIAEEVNLARVEELLKTESSQRLKFTRSARQAVIMRNAPVSLSLGALSDFSLPFASGKTEAFAKIWDYGVVSIQFQIPLAPGLNWEELIQLSAKLEQDTLIDEAARFRCQELVNVIKPALRDVHSWHEFEDYAVFFLEEISGIQKCSELLDQVDIARLIVAETSVNLADRAKKTILEGTYQYSDRDLTIVDWNSALVIEPSGLKEVPDIIEFALTHLMEMRYYDSLLDQKLALLYDSIEESRARFLSNRFTSLSREASARYIEFSEFIERVDNSFKVVGDYYLARIFRAAGEKFRIPEWESNVTRKINLFSSLSELLQGEVNVNRSLWLEITIVVLILFELVTTFMKIATGSGSG